MKILIIGEKRFRVLDMVREKLYLVGLVEWIEDVFFEKEFRELIIKVDFLLKDVVYFLGKLMD